MWVRNNKGNIFVGNLPPDFPDERLAEAFDQFGIVLSAAVARDPATGARLRYGFVDIATERAANEAISALNGHEIDGCKLNVKARERKAGGKAPAGRPRRPQSRTAAPNGSPRPAPPPRPMPASQAEPAPRPSQSQMAREGAPDLEPPPALRRDFEVVRRPVRRGQPSFQVERRPLPRRV
jgi:RNA recognition motif-containing protein